MIRLDFHAAARRRRRRRCINHDTFRAWRSGNLEQGNELALKVIVMVGTHNTYLLCRQQVEASVINRFIHQLPLRDPQVRLNESYTCVKESMIMIRLIITFRIGQSSLGVLAHTDPYR